jgi:biotin carboxylase
MKNVLVIIGGAEEHIIAICQAQKMGLLVCCIDGNELSAGFKYSDFAINKSTYDHIGICEELEQLVFDEYNLSGVMTLASDVPLTVAYVANHFGLNAISIDSAKIAMNKKEMKERFKACHVPTAMFVEASSYLSFLRKLERFRFPVIVKPVDSRGARGVQVIRHFKNKDLEEIFDNCIAHSESGKILIEEYLEGPQLSTEGFMIDGEAYIPAIFDRNYEFLEKYAPYVIENGGEMPSRYSKTYSLEITEVMKQAALSIGINDGIIKGDLVIHDGKIKVIELAARMSGGFFGTISTPYSTGVNLIEANINFAVGNKLSPSFFKPSKMQAVAIRFAFPNEGVVKDIVVSKNGVLTDSIYNKVFVKKGDTIEPITNHTARPAVVVCSGTNIENAIYNAESCLKSILIDTQ